MKHKLFSHFLSCILIISLLSSAGAQTFVNPVVPSKKITPPNQQRIEEEAMEAQKPGIVPSDIILPSDQLAWQYLAQHGYFLSGAPGPFLPEQPITLGEWVTLLYRAARLTTPFVSEFSYYRDISPEHWAYIPLEGFRMRRFLPDSKNGFILPDNSVSREEAAILLSKTIQSKWLTLTPEEATKTLAVYGLHSNTSNSSRLYHLARAIYAGFLLPLDNNETHQLTLALDKPLTRLDAIRMAYQRALIQEEERGFRPEKRRWLAPGLNLVITPTSALTFEQLAVGSNLYFSIANSFSADALALTLPRGTRLHGVVAAIDQPTHRVTLTFDRLNTPAGEFYNLKAALTLDFETQKEKEKRKSAQTFIVPGENFNITTEAGL